MVALSPNLIALMNGTIIEINIRTVTTNEIRAIDLLPYRSPLIKESKSAPVKTGISATGDGISDPKKLQRPRTIKTKAFIMLTKYTFMNFIFPIIV